MSLPSEDTNVIYSKQNGILFLHFYCDFFHRSIFFSKFCSLHSKHGWRNLFQSGVTQVHVKKTIEKFYGLNRQL